MPVSVNLVADPDEWARVMRLAGDRWQKLAKNIVGSAQEFGQHTMQDEMKTAELVYTGYMRKHITTPIGLEGDTVEGWVIPEAPYAQVMDEGRRPNGPMPPPAQLGLWAKRKQTKAWMGRGKRTELSVGFQHAKSIAKKGIKGRHYMDKTARKLERKLPDIWKRQVDRFLDEAT